MWQPLVEIEHYSVVHFTVLSFVMGGAHTRYVDPPGVHASLPCVKVQRCVIDSVVKRCLK